MVLTGPGADFLMDTSRYNKTQWHFRRKPDVFIFDNIYLVDRIFENVRLAKFAAI